MRRAYIHIGFGKTGSSSIQAHFSQNHHLEFGQGRLEYCCLMKTGQVLRGESLARAALNSPLGYISSHPDITALDEAAVRKAKASLDEMYSERITPLFSQEDWGRSAGHFKARKLFEALDVHVTAIAYVRPQVDWFNSAWWQWFAWSDGFNVPEDVVRAWGYNFMLWANQLAAWGRLDRVEKVVVRLQPADVLVDFFSLFDGVSAQPPPSIRANVSLSPTLIKLLRTYPSLRATHSAEVDVILSRFFKFEGKTPWVIERQLASKIVEATRADNERLKAMLDGGSWAKMAADPRWWEASFYESNRLWTPEELKLDEREVHDLLDQAIPAIIKFARANPRIS